MEPGRALITGIGGFVGGHLAAELLSNGWQVCGVDRRPRDYMGALAGVPIATADLADYGATEQMLLRFQPTHIVHLAGWAHVGKSWDYVYPPFQSNVLNTMNLFLSSAKLLHSPRLFLYVSSAEVYGRVSPEDLPVTEQTAENPTSPYGASKLTAERTLRDLRRHGFMPLVVARPFNHVGPGQSPDFALPSFARRVAAIEAGESSVFYHGNLANRRDFLDVRDVARAYRLILERGEDGETFVVSSGVAHSMSSVVEKLFHLARISPEMREDPELFRKADVPEFRGDSSWLRHRTGWEPRMLLEESLADILQEARQRLQTA